MAQQMKQLNKQFDENALILKRQKKQLHALKEQCAKLRNSCPHDAQIHHLTTRIEQC